MSASTAELQGATPDPSCLAQAWIFRQVAAYLSPVNVGDQQVGVMGNMCLIKKDTKKAKNM